MTRPSYNESRAGEAEVPPEVALTQRLVQAFSPSGQESAAAEVLLAAFGEAGFDEAYLDEAGNAVGILRCRGGAGRTLMMNGHIDTVPLGDEAQWPHPPLSGALAEGRLWGRGACDMKAALACMVVAAREAAPELEGTVIITGVVQEEVGGLGARHVGETLRADVVILGEPSKLKLMLGHRGRVEVEVSLPGRIAHAAKNELGDNALYRAGRLLGQLEGLELPAGGPLGGSSLTPTSLTSYPHNGKNVVPGRAELTLDYRNVPGDEPDAILARLQALDPEAQLSVPEEHAVSESGQVARSFPRIVPVYEVPDRHPDVAVARRALQGVLAEAGHPYGEGYWWFGTDAPHLAKTMPAGGVVLGFGPGEEELAHTTRESVPLAHLEAARRGYAALLRAFLGRGGAGA
jgi:succinyl-diaminopimelate desuccinylase